MDLSTASGLQKGADSGPVVVPGDLEKSRLIQVVSYLERTKMPPTGKLSDPELTALREWVKLGAQWPATATETPIPSASKKKGFTRAQTEFWSFRPLQRITPPPVRNESWVRSPIDRFVLARLESAQLSPALPADKRVLLRRATFDLTGLPPTPEEIDAFLADDSPDAFAKVVDRLLASPALRRTLGPPLAGRRPLRGVDRRRRRTIAYPHAWRYRDYVIDAFNSDKPYDRFIREQIAGDLLPPRRRPERNATSI